MESVNEACWKGYRRVGGKMKNGKMVPNCVPIKEDKDTESYFKRIFNEARMEAKEATTTASTGSYETPSAWSKSMLKKDWGGRKKTQIPGGKFVQIKKKCLTFPYCNQGDINALKLTELDVFENIVKKLALEYKIEEDLIKKLIREDILKNMNI